MVMFSHWKCSPQAHPFPWFLSPSGAFKPSLSWFLHMWNSVNSNNYYYLRLLWKLNELIYGKCTEKTWHIINYHYFKNPYTNNSSNLISGLNLSPLSSRITLQSFCSMFLLWWCTWLNLSKKKKKNVSLLYLAHKSWFFCILYLLINWWTLLSFIGNLTTYQALYYA